MAKSTIDLQEFATDFCVTRHEYFYSGGKKIKNLESKVQQEIREHVTPLVIPHSNSFVPNEVHAQVLAWLVNYLGLEVATGKTDFVCSLLDLAVDNIDFAELATVVCDTIIERLPVCSQQFCTNLVEATDKECTPCATIY